VSIGSPRCRSTRRSRAPATGVVCPVLVAAPTGGQAAAFRALAEAVLGALP
jgi:hypothetical protein